MDSGYATWMESQIHQAADYCKGLIRSGVFGDRVSFEDFIEFQDDFDSMISFGDINDAYATFREIGKPPGRIKIIWLFRHVAKCGEFAGIGSSGYSNAQGVGGMSLFLVNKQDIF